MFKEEKVAPISASLRIQEDSTEKNDLSSESNEDSFKSMSDKDESQQFLDENKHNVRQLRDRQAIKKPDFYGNPLSFLTEAIPSNYNEAVNL